MGAANVIPGVSGGTIALITNIYEDFINALKSCNGTAIKLLLTGQFKEFSNHINLPFLAAILLGIVISIFSIAKLFEFLLEEHPVQIWAFFFGLVLASVYYIGKTIKQLELEKHTSSTYWNYYCFIDFFFKPCSFRKHQLSFHFRLWYYWNMWHDFTRTFRILYSYVDGKLSTTNGNFYQ